MNSLELIQYKNPKSDKTVLFPYDSKSIDQKHNNKTLLLKKVKKDDAFTVLFLQNDISDKDEKILWQTVDSLSHIASIHSIIVGEDEKHLSNSTFLPPSQIGYALAGSDVIILFPSQLKTSVSPLLLALKYGVVPIVPTSLKLKGIIFPFDPLKEKGNGYVYPEDNVWNIFAKIIQAKENHSFPYDWETLVQACMNS